MTTAPIEEPRGIDAAIRLYTGRALTAPTIVAEDLDAEGCRGWAIRATVEGLGRVDYLVVFFEDMRTLDQIPARLIREELCEVRWTTWPPKNAARVHRFIAHNEDIVITHRAGDPKGDE